MARDVKEKLKISQKSSSKEAFSAKEIQEAREVKESAGEIVKTIESREGMGVAEIVEGKIAEKAKEGKKVVPAGSFPAVRTADEIEAIRTKLLQNLPSQEIMVKQIKRKLKVDERALTKQFKKIRKMGHKAAYQLNIVVAKLRKVREYLAILANATFEVIKQLWLKIVHDV